jgi:hypothetical protein
MDQAGRKRRDASRRLQASEHCPTAAVRLFGTSLPGGSSGGQSHWQKLLARRSGWHVLQFGNNQVRLLFVLSFKGQTYVVDMSAWRQGKEFVVACVEDFNLDECIAVLPSLDYHDDVKQVFEAGVSVVAEGPGSAACVLAPTAALSPGPADPSHGSVRICVSTVRPVTHEVVRQSGRKRDSNGETVSDDDVVSVDSGSEVPEISSASSCASVDTDVDSGIDDTAEGISVKKPDGSVGAGTFGSKKQDGSVGAGTFGSKGAGDAKGEGLLEVEDPDLAEGILEGEPAEISREEFRSSRHPPGTWKLWESTWFYITQTAGWLDIKIWMKGPFRNVTDGMGTSSFSKTLTCHHYGDELDEPWRCLLLLRSWSIWRAKWQGWARAKDCRLREVNRQLDRFIVDL